MPRLTASPSVLAPAPAAGVPVQVQVPVSVPVQVPVSVPVLVPVSVPVLVPVSVPVLVPVQVLARVPVQVLARVPVQVPVPLLALLLALAAPLWPVQALDREPPPRETPTYTDLDLARYSREREADQGDRTSSRPGDSAVESARRSVRRKPAPAETAVDDLQREAEERASEERYWRREAERVRERVRRLEARSEELAASLEERKRAKRKPGSPDPGLASLSRRIESARNQARQLWEAFEDRARRERALPGWIR